MICKISASLPKSSVYPFPPDFQSELPSRQGRARVSIKNRGGLGPVRALYAPAEQRSLYELLGVAETGSSFDDIKKAYKQMARKYHPDVAPPGRVDEHTRRFIMVKEAYETLSNPQKRALYDRDLYGGGGGGRGGGRPFGYQSYGYDNLQEEKEGWRIRWEAQLEELRRRRTNFSRGRNSWGAQMRDTTRR